MRTLAGLTEQEYKRIVDLLGREPSFTELQMYGVMWSEHCSYKNSRSVLKLLPTEGGRVLQGPGENAGVIDVGDGIAVAFKVESHNHPSAIEPFQGATTGVGGILRDVFTMGARPVALLNSLRFAPPETDRQRHLLAGVVAGIGHYGNCMGIPTVGGEVYFEPCYGDNPLVNAMCVGVLPAGKIRKGLAAGVGNPILVVGARTGRDGIGGASFASEELSDASEERRPSVQVGDPFMEKLLLEACMELFETDAVVGIQDMGAAGLTSSACEMAARGGVGLEFDVALVPAREPGMQPWEYLLSESQERMLVCVRQGHEETVFRIFAKWGLQAAVIGQVTADGLIRVLHHGQVAAELPAHSLAGGAPVYERPAAVPASLAARQAFTWAALPELADYSEVLLRLMGSWNLCSRRWVYRQFDHQVLLGTVVAPGGDAAVIRLGGAAACLPGADPQLRQTRRGLALSLDGNGRYVYLNPRRGGALAVAEGARNVVCSGGEPAAITNCLNFGSPENPEIFYQFSEAAAGMAEACRALGTPVTGGNVSFYNEYLDEGRTQAVYPTPTIGMVGVVEDVAHATGAGLRQKGDVLYLLGRNLPELGGTEYLKEVHGVVAGDAPSLDLGLERRVQGAALAAIRAGLTHSAHDCSDGGLAVALAEMALAAAEPELGFTVELGLGDCQRLDELLFGESASRILLAVSAERVAEIERLLCDFDIPVSRLGTAGGDRVHISVAGRGTVVDLPVADLRRVWEEAIPWALG